MNLRTRTFSIAWALSLAACDPMEEPAVGDAEVTLAAPDELDLLLPLCMSLPPEADAEAPPPANNPDLTDAPQVAEGVCQGEWETKSERTNCNTCVFTRGNGGTIYNKYRRWCYKPPNPVACGGCGPWEYDGYDCYDIDICT
ncbi:hypothetical protein [Nannocystis sp. SCPEA4]|uniref:hypothetical protein n=1 Tax=Nannocystis sp. SCPEA4 TaxID=2996787 RepID=UPI0022707A83|nr:hypothetical protein [Nannocystis sp. SCPEA4]MCY1057712.1 hypothetical protein [Nannocystis sp. SCPEA4]